MKRRKGIAGLALMLSLMLPGNALAAAVPATGQEDTAPVSAGTGPALVSEAGSDREAASGESQSQAETSERAGDPLAAGPAGGGLTQEQRAVLSDNLLEYDEIADRIEYFNKDYKNTKTTLYSMTMSLDAADDLAEEANYLLEDALDLKEDDMDAETRVLYEGYKEAARALRKQAQKLTNDDLSGTYARTLRQVKNQLTQVVQNLMMQYRSVSAKVSLAAKNVEFAQGSFQMKQTMTATGQVSADELLAAEETLRQAESTYQQAQSGADTLRSNILILLGWDEDAPVEFAPLDLSVLAEEETLDLAADQAAAIGANSDLMSIRSAAAEGAAERTVKKRNVALTQDTIRIQMEKLYGERLTARTKYLAACAQMEAADLTMQAAQKKYELGMSGRLEHLGAELSWLSAQADYADAAMVRLQAIEDYNWAVKGLLTSE